MFGYIELMRALWTRAQDSIKSLSMGTVLAAVVFALMFMALPGGWFVDLRRFEWDWGCPFPIFRVSSGEGDFHALWWCWYYTLPLDLVFWLLFFFCAAIIAGVISRRMRGRIRPVCALGALGCLTGVIYALVYRAVWYVFIETLYFKVVA